MYYLKCGHCAEYSALKSEYITFCDHCGKKLPVSYADWRAGNPDGDFETFRAAHGITAADYQAIMKKRYRQGFDLRKKTALITGLVVLLAFSALGAWYGPSLVKMLREPAVSPALLEATNWRTFRGNVLQLQTPLSLSPVTAKEAANMRIKVFKGGSRTEGLIIQMQEAVYLSDADIELEPVADEIAESLSNLPNISRFTMKEQLLDVSGRKAVWQHGTYIYQQTAEMEFNSLVMVQGGTRVQVLITHRGNDETGREVAEKVVRSARLN